MIDRRQHDEEHEADAEAPGDQLLLDRQQRLDGGVAQFFVQIGLGVNATWFISPEGLRCRFERLMSARERRL